MPGRQKEINILVVSKIQFFFFCIGFIKNKNPIKSRLLVTIILEVLIAEQGNAVPMAD